MRPNERESAADLYERADDGGDLGALRRHGALDEDGGGVEQDFIKAGELYQQVGEGGDALATEFLGELNEKGLGRPQGHQKASVL